MVLIDSSKFTEKLVGVTCYLLTMNSFGDAVYL